MPNLSLWKRRLRPAFVLSELRRIGRKLWRKLRDPYRGVATLPAEGEPRGRALVSFWLDPFLVPEGEELPHSHTAYWESREIARTWARLGFEVDVIHWTNSRFVPERPYDVLVDVRLNLERLAPLVGEECLRVQHIETGHHLFHNRAQRERLDALERRRGVRLKPVKMIEENRAIEHAHFATTTGNRFTIDTYAHAGREIFPVPLSAPFRFPSPAGKDFDACRRTWIWFGSGGLVHKGLDVVLEAFAGMPDHRLIVCGPVQAERDFEACYARELYDTPNIETVGWVDIAGERFRDVCARAAGVVYPSCSESGGGSVVTCLHAGLVPVLTYEASVDLHDFGVLLPDARIETVRRVVAETASLPAEELCRRAVAAWEHARREHTRERFSERYRAAAEEMLARHRARPSASPVAAPRE